MPGILVFTLEVDMLNHRITIVRDGDGPKP